MTEPGEALSLEDQQWRKEVHQRYFQAVKGRASEVKESFVGKTLVKDREIADPVKQLRNDGSGRTCLAAVAVNALEVFGVTEIPQEYGMVEDDSRKLLPYENCVVYPPIAYVSKEAGLNKQEMFTSNIENFLKGNPKNIAKL